MSFLAPLFLVGLAGLAVPVFIHLIQREKKQVVLFPSLMFLQRIPYQSIRRRHIHNWVLLLIRLAVMALIVAAFGRPFLRRAERVSAATSGSREVVVLLDRSYSMGYADRWERARAAARDAVNTLGVTDRASLVLFSSDAEVAVRSTSERARLLSAIDAASPSAGSTRYAPVLKVAGSILGESSLPRLETVLISDFQRGGWLGTDAVQLPAGATVRTVAIDSRRDVPNAAVSGVSLERSTFSNQERVVVTAGLINHSATPLSKGDVSLEIGGRVVQTEHVTIAPGGTASVSFAPVTVTARNMRGSVRLAPDGLERDNVLYFVVSPLELFHVLVVDRGGAGGSASLYLLRALSIGDAPKFDVSVSVPDAIADDALARAAVVVLNDVPVTAALAARLGKFVERGGGLFVVVGPRASWPAANADLMPGVAAGPVDRSRGDAARLGAIQYGHPVFEVFRAPRSGDFSVVQFYGYRLVTPAKAARVLARFDGGAPALLERQVGRGRVLMWASSVDLLWNDLPLKPMFLPFVHRALRHLTAYAEPAPWLTVGQVLDPSTLDPTAPEAASVALTPSGRRVAIGRTGGDVLVMNEQGFYEVRGIQAGAEGTVVASNVDVSESDLTTLDPREIVAAATAVPGALNTARREAPLSPEAQERTQRIWWYLLCAGLLLLGADTVLSNRLSRA